MHELSVARALVETVTSAVRSRGGEAGRVREVRLRIGVLSGIVPDAIAFCYDVVTEGTPLAGSVLVTQRVPAAGRCGTCAAEVTASGASFPVCPACARPVTTLTTGRELEISQVVLDDLADQEDPPATAGLDPATTPAQPAATSARSARSAVPA